MSSVPKRGSQEEGGHLPSSSVRPTSVGEQEESHAYPRANYGPVQENRPLPRVESRDGERRSPLPSVYRMPSVSMTDTHASNPAPVLEVRPDSRDSKEGRESKGVEGNKEVKVESRDVHHQSGKVEKESRSENRMDDSKEVKYERDRGNDSRSKEVKVESRDVHHQSSKGDKEGRLDNRMGESKEGKYERDRGNAVSGVVAKKLPSWKYLPPEHRVKGNPDAQGGESWNNPHRVKGTVERNSGGGGIPLTYNTSLLAPKQEAAPKDVIPIGTIPVMKERVEGNEAVGENRVDLKADDKHKDSKREEGKNHDRPESEKEKSDYRSNLQPGSSSNNDSKETTRELKESECRDRERKDIPKEKERIKEREKDRVDKEGRNCMEKEGYLNDKNLADKPPVQENLALETKKPTDSWRNLEREAKERRKERDGDVEGERPEKRRCYEKEPDEGVADVDGGTDKERDGFSSGVQQKKRMLRPRGSPQVGNRDARFKSRGQDAEGSQGKPEFSTGYKVGECLQELTKLWKEYESAQVDKNSDNPYNGPTLEIRIPAEHVTATNRQVRGGQLWGTDIYTDDSDLVAVLMHTGYCRPTASPPPAAIQELRATIRVLPPQDSYVSTLRNNVRSRAWGAAIGCSYRVERCCIMKKVGGSIGLEPCLTQTSTIEPTLAPVTVERTMTTRAAASNALRQQRFVREVTIQYNLCNEPWTKYSISIVADKGLKKPFYTSARLKKGEVLYLETHFRRYELCFSGEKIVKSSSASQIHEMETGTSQNHGSSVNGDRNMADGDSVIVDLFRWSRCKKPLPQNVMRSIGIPLPLDHVEVLEENIDWEDVQWSQTGVWIAGKEYQLARVHFMSPN